MNNVKKPFFADAELFPLMLMDKHLTAMTTNKPHLELVPHAHDRLSFAHLLQREKRNKIMGISSSLTFVGFLLFFRNRRCCDFTSDHHHRSSYVLPTTAQAWHTYILLPPLGLCVYVCYSSTLNYDLA